MIVWIDAQLSPQLAPWIEKTFQIKAHAVRELGLREAKDAEIFEAARHAGAMAMTKDKDFVDLLARFGPPPQIIWITLGNTTNDKLKEVLKLNFGDVQKHMDRKEPLIEIRDAQ